MAFGITAEGFELKTLRDILTEIEDDQHAEIDPLLDVSPVSPDGQRNAITARQAALCWELLEQCYDGHDPDKAEGDQLIATCKLTGTVPRAATYSEVDCTVNLDSGTTLQPDVHFASINGKPDVLFTPKAEYTAAVGGAQTVRFRAQVAGPVVCNAGTLTVIASPLVGWNSITNPLDATTGLPADTDETLRARRDEELAKAGSSTVRAIKADVLAVSENGIGPTSVLVLENDTDTTNVDGVPAHAFEVIVYDPTPITNTLIAQAIWDTKPAGIKAHGAITANATDPDTGELHPVKFSRPTAKNVYVTFETVTTGPGYVGDAAFKTAVVSYLRGKHSIGDDVAELQCWLAAGSVTGVLKIGAVKLGFAAAPTGTDDLAIAPREIAAFDTSRIVKT